MRRARRHIRNVPDSDTHALMAIVGMGLACEALISARRAEGIPMDRRTFLHVAAGLSLGPVSGAFSASAQTAWPSQSVTIVVPFASGGQADLAARPLALGLTKILRTIRLSTTTARAPAVLLERQQMI